MSKFKFIFPILLLGIAIGYWFISSFKEKPILQKETQVLGVTGEVSPQIASAWFVAPDAQKIKLYPNYQEKITAIEAKNKYGCESIISGGFYSAENRALGLVISEKQQFANYRESDLFNGIYSVNDFLIPRITREVPEDALRIALQAGPLLIENSFSQTLQLNTDKEARRIVVATTGDNQTIFIVFYNPNSLFMGPTLADLPKQLDIFQKQNNLGIADALNLDGGTASAFYNADLSLPEASTVGSFFCILPR